MDTSLLEVVLVVAGAVAVAVTAWAISWYRQSKLLPQAEQWLPVEARIASGALEATRESGRIVLDICIFLPGFRRVLLGAFFP